MQGGLHMVSFRKVAVFIGVVGLLLSVVDLVDAAHTKAHKRATTTTESGEPTTLPGRGPGAPEMILQGPVVAVSPATGFIVIRHGPGKKDAEEIPIDLDQKTTLTRGGKTISIDEVRVGDHVRVSYSGQPGEVSKTVEVRGGPAARRGARM